MDGMALQRHLAASAAASSGVAAQPLVMMPWMQQQQAMALALAAGLGPAWMSLTDQPHQTPHMISAALAAGLMQWAPALQPLPPQPPPPPPQPPPPQPPSPQDEAHN
jgi:hypothetical protein